MNENIENRSETIQSIVVRQNKRIRNLKLENETLRDENETLDETNELLIKEVQELKAELNRIKQMSMFEFGNTYCSDADLEDAGHALARELLGGA